MEDTPRRIPADRYRSRAWHDLEAERLWPRVWQIACNVDCVREAGDWFEYEIGRLSILVVRGDDGLLRAFQNACRHRGSSCCTAPARGCARSAARTTTGATTSPVTCAGPPTTAWAPGGPGA